MPDHAALDLNIHCRQMSQSIACCVAAILLLLAPASCVKDVHHILLEDLCKDIQRIVVVILKLHNAAACSMSPSQCLEEAPKCITTQASQGTDIHQAHFASAQIADSSDTCVPTQSTPITAAQTRIEEALQWSLQVLQSTFAKYSEQLGPEQLQPGAPLNDKCYMALGIVAAILLSNVPIEIRRAAVRVS